LRFTFWASATAEMISLGVEGLVDDVSVLLSVLVAIFFLSFFAFDVVAAFADLERAILGGAALDLSAPFGVDATLVATSAFFSAEALEVATVDDRDFPTAFA